MIRFTSLFAGFVCAGIALAGPPLETDDPDTPGPGNWEINIASTLEKRGGIWEIKPVLDLNYGLGERVQLKVKPRLVILDEPSRVARSGAGNIQLGVKWRFADEDDFGAAISIYPQLDLNPSGHSVARGLVDDGTDFTLAGVEQLVAAAPPLPARSMDVLPPGPDAILSATEISVVSGWADAISDAIHHGY